MEPKQAWGAFTIIVILADAIATALLVSIDIEPVLVLAVALIVLLVYFYVLYKRYHVEVVPENDIMLFDDPDDLSILCTIYGLDSKGNEAELRNRLLAFATAHGDSAFVWVAPKAVQFFGTALEISPTPGAPRATSAKSLLGEKSGSAARVSRVKRCPICDARTPSKGSICKECGADLEFYVALGESKVGKLVLSEKAGELRRKLRYEVPSLRGNR
jgi:hypothetical protein